MQQITTFSFTVPTFENEQKIADKIAEAIESILEREIELEVNHYPEME